MDGYTHTHPNFWVLDQYVLLDASRRWVVVLNLRTYVHKTTKDTRQGGWGYL